MKPTHQHRLALFIALSLAIHGLMLSVDTSDTETIQHEQGGSWLQLQLQQKLSDKKKQSIGRQTLAEKKQLQTLTTRSATEQHHAAPKTHAESITPAEAADKLAEFDNSLIVAKPDTTRISRIVADEFARHFYYPATARRRNWQGDVVLQFTLMPDGRIEHIRINKSSGYEVLDEAAMDVMSRIKSERQLALALNGRMLDHLLPISYRLKDAL